MLTFWTWREKPMMTLRLRVAAGGGVEMVRPSLIPGIADRGSHSGGKLEGFLMAVPPGEVFKASDFYDFAHQCLISDETAKRALKRWLERGELERPEGVRRGEYRRRPLS